MKKLLFFVLMTGLSKSLYGLEVTPPIAIKGGVDHYNDQSDVLDTRAVDLRNLVPNSLGTSSVRDGSELFINQAVSTNPVNSIYWASVDYSTYSKTALIMTSWNKIYVSTSPDKNNPSWVIVKDNLVTHNQRFSFANSGGIIVMTGEALTDEIFKYNILTSSFSELIAVDSDSSTVKVRAKYVLAPNGYLVLGHCAEVDNLTANTTNYPSRVRYSLFNQISSFTASRYIDVRLNDGEGITGMTEKGGTVGNIICIYKPNTVSNISYRVLDLDEFGGNIVVDTVANGFGCISPYALINIGAYDIVPTQDGIIFYDGGRKSRLNLIEEIKPINTLIKSDYEDTIRYLTYDKTVAFYYPRKQWYVLSIVNPFIYPSGKNNLVYVLDLKTGEWWIMDNWLAKSFTVKNGIKDNGTPLYGSSIDGYVYEFDLPSAIDDARKEIVIDHCESTLTWKSNPTFSKESGHIVEGTGAIKLTSNITTNYYSSATKIDLIDFSEYPDGFRVSRTDDQLSFKLRVSSIGFLDYLRIDLQYEVTETSFTTYFSSVSLSSSSLLNYLTVKPDLSTSFSEVTVDLSSFPIPASWSEIVNPITGFQRVPFARCLTIYGLRFILNSISTCNVIIDDIRVVQGGPASINAWYVTKNFNFGSIKNKEFRQVIVSADQEATSSFSMDIFTGHGEFRNRVESAARIPKEIFVCSYKGIDGLTRLKSNDFRVIDSTQFPNSNVIDYLNGEATEDKLIMYDRVAYRFLMLDKSDPSIIISSYGSLGTGTTNTDTVNQMCVVDIEGREYVLATDSLNNRILKFDITNDDFQFVNSYGEIGTGTTNYLVPTGITADSAGNVWVLDDGNFRIVKLNFSDMGYISERSIDSNTVGEGVLRNDGTNLFAAYNKVASKPFLQDVVLEKRTKGSMDLIQRTTLRPVGVLDQSTYTISGDFALLGRYLFIGFTKDLSQTGVYYVQKLLKDGFDVIDEYSTPNTQFSIIGDGKSYNSTTHTVKRNIEAQENPFCQLRFYTDEKKDNKITFKSFSFAYNLHEYSEGR